MVKLPVLLLSFVVVVLLLGCVSLQSPQSGSVLQEVPKLPSFPQQKTADDSAPIVKGPASDAVVYKPLKTQDAKDALLSGKIDYYMESLPIADAAALKNDSRASLQVATVSIYGFYMNPAPAPQGELNPLSLQKVRFALQYLIDRDEIVDKAFDGLAAPAITDPWPGHPAYEPIKKTVESFGIKSDKAKAISMISEAMKEAGATNQSGIWQFNGKPLAIKLYAYDSGAYQPIASIIADSLAEAGFTVNKTIVDRNAPDSEFPPYSTDPARLEWHISPSGYIFYDASKHMVTSVLGAGEGMDGWWSYNNTAAKEIEKKMADCGGESEWNALNSQLASILINDSTGIWLATPESTYVSRKEVLGLSEDHFVGIRTYANIREAHVLNKSSLVVGTPGAHYEGWGWNPVVINSIYAMDVVNSIHDPAIRSNMATLEKEGFRWNFTIDGGPSESMAVPSDAFIWNYSSKRWEAVGGGKFAKAKVTYDLSKYVGTNWHHGQKITWGDVLYFLASTWDRSFDEKKQSISSARWQSGLNSIVGMRISGSTLEAYQREWNIDRDEMLIVARMFQRSAPLEEYAAMDSLVFGSGKYQYGESEDSLPILDLLNESQVSEVLASAHGLSFADVSPMATAGGKTYVTEKELSMRIAALDSWNAAHHSLVISEGPFYIDHFDSADGSLYLRAFRDSTYPFSPGHWKK